MRMCPHWGLRKRCYMTSAVSSYMCACVNRWTIVWGHQCCGWSTGISICLISLIREKKSSLRKNVVTIICWLCSSHAPVWAPLLHSISHLLLCWTQLWSFLVSFLLLACIHFIYIKLKNIDKYRFNLYNIYIIYNNYIERFFNNLFV